MNQIGTLVQKQMKVMLPDSELQCYHRQWSEEKIDGVVSEIIRKLVNNPRFSEVMKTKINTSVDTSEAEKRTC